MQIHYGWVGLIITLSLHLVAIVWWAATINQKLSSVEKTLIHIDRDIDKLRENITTSWKRIDSVFEIISKR